MSKRKKYVVVGHNGKACHRCGRSTEIREHPEVTEKHLAQPYYYSRWFNCVNPKCRTTLIMDDQYRIPPVEAPVRYQPPDIVIEVLNALSASRAGKLPWDD